MATRAISILAINVGESWTSERGTFAVGFKSRVQNNEDNLFVLAIWYVVDPGTVVWTGKSLENDEPLLVRQDAALLLTNDALVVKQDADGKTTWKTVIISCDQCIAKARIADSGNLVMLDQHDEILWQSFDSPTHSLLPGQQLTGSMTLVAGKYSLELDAIRVMLRYKEYLTQPYWSMTNSNLSVTNFSTLDILPRLNLSNDGALTFFDGSGNSWDNSLQDRSMRYALDYGSREIVSRRLTLDEDGNLGMYSLQLNSSSWITVWKAVPMECDVFGVCGEFGICSYRPQKTCTCPPGFHRINQRDPSAGCAYNTPLQCDAPDNEFVRLVRADYPWNDFNFNPKLVTSLEGCMESCRRDCNCLAAAYKYQGAGLCFHKGNAGKLFNGIQTVSQENFVLLKISRRSQVHDSSLYRSYRDNSDAFIAGLDTTTTVIPLSSSNLKYHALLGISIAEGVLIIIALVFVIWMTKRKSK